MNTPKDQYTDMQRSFYNKHSGDLKGAKQVVSPHYDIMREQATVEARFMLENMASRRGDEIALNDLHVFDYGCGVGRTMEAFVDNGVVHVDGADISEEMLRHASSSPLLKNSTFSLSSGCSISSVPSDHYDLVYSCLCMHHISMRSVRQNILSELHRILKPTGIAIIQFNFFPGIRERHIPTNHAGWEENRQASTTNSGCDVWITPDSLPLVYTDYAEFFHDIRFEEVSTCEYGKSEYNGNAVYQYPRNPFFVSGTKKPMLVKMLYKHATP